MPYIKSENRKKFIKTLSEAQLVFDKNTTPGDFNYLVSKLAKIYIWYKGESYQTYNDLMGALTGAQLELYRKKISSYEDEKLNENGDI